MKATLKEPNNALETLQWLVDNRSRNQACAIKLFRLLKENQAEIKRKDYLFVQDLVGITFSLWRAVFLADKTGLRAESLKFAIAFLETLIADNAINYSQDKKFREWTFNYYTNNVRVTLISLNVRRPQIVPKWVKKGRGPKERWQYGQELLEKTIERFAIDLGVRL